MHDRPVNEQERNALGALHTALLACRDARIEIAPAPSGIYVRQCEEEWYIDSKGPTLESFDLAEYRQLPEPAQRVKRYSSTTQEAEAMFEDDTGEWVKLTDVLAIQKAGLKVIE